MKVALEVAQADIQKWLDSKKIYQETRDRHKDQIDLLTEAMVNGDLILNEDNTFTQKLLWPIGEGGAISELKYRHRINDKMVQGNKKGVGNMDFDGQFNAVLATLTGQNRSIIESMDSVDKKIANAIGVFFM